MFAVAHGDEKSEKVLRRLVMRTLQDCPNLILLRLAYLLTEHLDYISQKDLLLLVFAKNESEDFQKFPGSKVLIAGQDATPKLGKLVLVDQVPPGFWFLKVDEDV